ncbi:MULTISPECIES: S24 family peptidase [Erwinia]|uniref:S24 family peptidase n=1 Tax=Erwinia TaxID=551 RepID=UPI0005536D2B|nr:MULTISPECIES: S24 family peptidase [Erwinia]
MNFLRPTELHALFHLPLYLERVPCGSPLPACGDIEQHLDLSELLVRRPETTWFIRVCGESMKEAGIDDGDLLVVDSALTAGHGDMVIVAIEGEFAVRKLQLNPSVQFVDLRVDQKTIAIDAEPDIFGVVTFTIKAMEQ